MSRPERVRVNRVNWKMSPAYSKGYMQGLLEQERDDKGKFHVEINYRELHALIQDRGRITLRHNSYPMVILTLSLVSEEAYYLKAIADKLKWTRFQQWAKGRSIQLIWQGLDAQILIQKILRYIFPESDMHEKALKALTWRKTGGTDAIEAELKEAAMW